MTNEHADGDVFKTDIEFKLLFGHERRATPDGLCSRCANKIDACVCVQNHRAMQKAALPIVTATREKTNERTRSTSPEISPSADPKR